MGAKEKTIGGIDPNAFDAQMLLLDAYMDNLKSGGSNIKIKTGAKVSTGRGELARKVTRNVPYFGESGGPARSGRSTTDTGVPSINRIMPIGTVSANGINDFILQATPNELAQLYVKIRLSLYNPLTEAEIEIPITAAPNLGYLFGQQDSSGYYSTNQVGLKSLSMRLDGRDNPFYAKAYLVDMELSFDSINTFLDPIGRTMGVDMNSVNKSTNRNQLLGLTYAQAFRSPGRTITQPFYTKLSIGYDSANQEILTKYNLRRPDMQFVLFLTLIKTSIDIQENLKTVIKVEYQSREENVFNSTLAFDFLGLDVAAAEEKLKKTIDTASVQRAAEQEARKAYAEAAANKVVNSKKYREFRDKFEQIEQLDGSVGDKLQKGKDDQGLVLTLSSGERFAFEDRSDFNKFQGEFKNLEKSLNEQALLEKYTKKYDQDYGGTSRDKFRDRRIRDARNQLANVRHNELVKAIKDTFKFDDEKTRKQKIIKTIFLSSRDLYRYYDYYAREQRGKGVVDGEEKNDATTSEERKQALEDQKGGLAADAAESDREDKSEQNANATTSTVKRKVVSKQQATSTGDMDTPKEVNEYAKNIESLMIDLGKQKQIDYILFGDLLRLLYLRLYDIKSTQLKKLKTSQTLSGDADRIVNSIEKSTILFSSIKFESLERTNNDGTGKQISRSVYDIPISVAYIKYMLAKRLYGKSNLTYTVLQMIDDVFDLINLTRKRKQQVLNSNASIGNFTLKSNTYPLIFNKPEDERAASAPIPQVSQYNAGPVVSQTSLKPRFEICMDPNAKNVRSGMVIFVKRVGDDKKPDMEDDIAPKFIFGGVSKGIIKKFQVNEISDDDTQKMVMEQIRGTINQVVPSFFEVTIGTVLAPFFQLGMFIKVLAPTLNSGSPVRRNSGAVAFGAAAANLFLEGDYQVSAVNHEYTAGGSWTSSIKAVLFNSDRKNAINASKTIDSRQAAKTAAEKEKARINEYKKSAKLVVPEEQIAKDVDEGTIKTTSKKINDFVYVESTDAVQERGKSESANRGQGYKSKM